MTATQDLDTLCINTIRTLSIDAVQAANSGHPGTPMALAPLVYTLWNRVMRFDPQDPIWPNRDRFVLSNGHASMLLWSVLHLTGTQAVNAEYETRRQARGHARRHPPLPPARQQGARPSRIPLGLGRRRRPPARSARASRRAWAWRSAQRWLASRYNRPGFDVFDYDIYAVCGDGCLMEGVGSEAASLAGHLGLDNLCWIYDNNHITIEGSTQITFTEDVAARFLGYGWNVLRVGDANDIDRIEHALDVFRKTTGRPTLIILDSHIGYGSPQPAGHGRRARRAARRRGGAPDQARLRLAGGRAVPRARRRARALRRGHRRARRGGAHGVERTLRRVSRDSIRSWPTRVDQMQRRELPAGWDATCRCSPPTRKASPGATRRARC